MSFEKRTRTRHALPSDQWEIVFRLMRIGPHFSRATTAFLHDSLPHSPATFSNEQIELVDEAIYTRFHASQRVEGEVALCESTTALWKGLARLALDDSEIEARIVPTAQLNPDRSLADNFPYLDDVTEEARELVKNLRLFGGAEDIDLSAELDSLAYPDR